MCLLWVVHLPSFIIFATISSAIFVLAFHLPVKLLFVILAFGID
jgi:hypothetical protein